MHSQSSCCSFFVRLTQEIVQPPSLRCLVVFGPVGQFQVKLKTGRWMREQFLPFAAKVAGLWAQQLCVVCLPAGKHTMVFSTAVMGRRTINTTVEWRSEGAEFLRCYEGYAFLLLVGWFCLLFFCGWGCPYETSEVQELSGKSHFTLLNCSLNGSLSHRCTCWMT